MGIATYEFYLDKITSVSPILVEYFDSLYDFKGDLKSKVPLEEQKYNFLKEILPSFKYAEPPSHESPTYKALYVHNQLIKYVSQKVAEHNNLQLNKQVTQSGPSKVAKPCVTLVYTQDIDLKKRWSENIAPIDSTIFILDSTPTFTYKSFRRLRG